MFYFCFKIVNRIALKFYFKKIEIVGLENVPKDCPLVVAPNHQNAFIDAFLVGAFMPVPIYFLTRSDVFNRWSKPILKLVNMMPIYRIRDGYASLTQNEAIFKTCEELFRRKKSILIFPEGNHGEDHYLRPLTKGAARLALNSEQVIDESLKVLPVGLNYFNHTKPSSKLIIAFGVPIHVSDFVKKYQESSGSGLTTMREAISDGIKSTLIIPDKTDDYEQLKQTIFQRKNEKLSFAELRKIKASSENIEPPKTSSHWIPKILNPVPFLLIKKILSGVKDVVFKSSVKYAVGVFAFPIWWLISFAVFYWLLGIIPATIIVLAMILSLIASYKWFR